MAKRLTDVSINELSIVMKAEDGREFAPRNPQATMLAFKGAEKKKTAVAKALDTLKGYFMGGDAASYPVTEAADNIDDDGDGPQDYNAIVGALCSVYYDIQNAFGISDDEARSAAICACIDSFIKGLKGMLEGDDDDMADKAGARHSQQDFEHLQGIAEAMQGMNAHIEAIGGALKKLGVTAAQSSDEGNTGPDEDSGPDSSDTDDDTGESRGAKAKKKPEGEYGDVQYADEKNKKYPIDTEEHARAAWSYINQEKNAEEYSADELKDVRSRIMAACKKFGIEIDDSKKAEEVEMNQEQIAAMIAEAANTAAKAAATETAESVKAELQPQIDAAKAEAAAAKAEADKNAELANAYKAQAEANTAVLARLGGSPSSMTALAASVEVQKAGSDRLTRIFREQMSANPVSTVF